MGLSLIGVLQELYRSEISVEMSCFWDAGWTIKLLGLSNGFKAEAVFENEKIEDAAQWLQEQAFFHFPNSEFTRLWKPLI